MQRLILLVCWVRLIDSFTFINPSVQPSVLTINTVTSYNFFIMRSYDINLNPTPYASQPVPAGSTIVIQFPSQYNFSANTPTVT